MAILVTLSFFFIMVAENMPATSEAVPLVGMYYTVTMIEVSSAFFMTCWVLRFHHMNPTEGEVPKWVKVKFPLISSYVQKCTSLYRKTAEAAVHGYLIPTQVIFTGCAHAKCDAGVRCVLLAFCPLFLD